MNADWVKFVHFVSHIVTGPHSRCLLVMSFAFVSRQVISEENSLMINVNKEPHQTEVLCS